MAEAYQVSAFFVGAVPITDAGLHGHTLDLPTESSDDDFSPRLATAATPSSRSAARAHCRSDADAMSDHDLLGSAGGIGSI